LAGVSGVIYMKKKSRFEELDSDPNATRGAVDAAASETRSVGTFNLVFSATALAGAAATAILYLTTPKTGARDVALVPWATPDSAGAVFLQAF
jgi:hypothetical protein